MFVRFSRYVSNQYLLFSVSNLVVKLIILAAIMLFTAARPVRADLIINGGFETGSAVIGTPTTFGTWGGDVAAFTGATSGITPFEGTRMLQFINTTGSGPSGSFTSAQYFQNVDLSAYAAEIATGHAALNASVRYNRVAGDAETDRLFIFRIRARSGTPTSFTDLSVVTVNLDSDSDPSTWQLSSINNFLLPLGTTFAQIEIQANEDVFNDAGNPEFDGHFADAVSMEIATVPEPNSLCLLGAAIGLYFAVGLVCRSMRRGKGKEIFA